MKRIKYTIITFLLIAASSGDAIALSTYKDDASGCSSYSLCLIMNIIMTVMALSWCIYILYKFKIEQRKETESQHKLSSLLNTMPIFYMCKEMVRDENGVIVDTIYRNVNKHFSDRFYKEKECIGKYGSALFPDSMPVFMQAANTAVNTGEAVTFQYNYETIGTYFDVVAIPSMDGKFVDFFCLDITELHYTQEKLKKTNKKLLMALKMTHVTSWDWDLRTRIIHCNENISSGKSYEEDFSDHEIDISEDKYFSFICKKDRERIRKAADDLMAGKINNVIEEYGVIHIIKGKRSFEWVEVYAEVGKTDHNGKPLSLVGSRQIITRRKHIEHELEKAKLKAEETNCLKSACLANMSHEIRTSLNAIVGFGGVLAVTDDMAERKEYSGIIERNSELLLQQVNDILDLSKTEGGTIGYNHSDFDLNQQMEELDRILRMRMIADRKVTLTYTPGEKQCMINSDRNRLSHLIINLVTNAIKFTEKGSICYGYELKGNVIRFYVTDTGCGIEESKIGSIFNRFVKLNAFVQGSGLGLPICKAIVENMGGEINVESEYGKGSTFSFTLPYIPVGSIRREHNEKKQEILEAKQKIRLLVAEDNESNFKLIEAILGKEYELHHAWNGQEAVEMFKECNPQLVLMDINMPVMNGYEATSEIRKISPSVPIMALTAYAFASDKERVLQSGMNEYMSKPINAKMLKEKVLNLLKQNFMML